MSMHTMVRFAAAAVVIVVLVGGCNREGLPGLGRVTGTVTMDGKPVPQASIVFTPKEVGATASMGSTDDSGHYELYYSRDAKGAKVGQHSVTINDYRAADESGDAGQKETIPMKYNVKTELTADVKRGNNKIDFDLKSGGEILQPGEEEGAKGKKGARSATGC